MRLRIITHVGVFKLDLNAHFLEKIGRTYSGQFKHLRALKSSAQRITSFAARERYLYGKYEIIRLNSYYYVRQA